MTGSMRLIGVADLLGRVIVGDLLWQSHPDHFPALSTEVEDRMRKMIGATRGSVPWVL